MKEVLIKILQFLGLAFWVEIVTDNPCCTYYFGPFFSNEEAQAAKNGYVEDLENEGAQGIVVSVKRCKPSKLTIFDELGEPSEREKISSFSGQPS
ncbi:MAG: DUF1816 domain-containing protein [Microcoleus sp. SIO2G3]|nr:DUF1816 domain-containing protein [Microcoleus sp. SIO2G3]